MLMQPMTILRSIFSIQSTLAPFHPLLIEGHTRDTREPDIVAKKIVTNLRQSWKERNITKPPILITQGDPLTGMSSTYYMPNSFFNPTALPLHI